MTNWEDIFGATAVPVWLHDFDRDPFAAVDAALWGKYYFDSLNVADPADLLIDWALGIGQQNDFFGRLDQALAQWVNRNWGRKPIANGRNSPAATAVAWMQLTEVVANVDSLREAPRALRQYFDERQAYLGPLCEGSSRDPLGIYLYAVARCQEDRSLLPVWWKYCDLVVGIPWYHGLYGIWGLRSLPPATEGERGRFPEHVAIGLTRLAIGLYQRSQEWSLTPNDARAEFQRVAHLTMMAYPFPERWHACWSDQIASGRIPKEPVEWMRKLVPGIDKRQSPRQKRAASPVASRSWRKDAERIVAHLQKDFQAGLLEAEKLIGEEHLYAEKTGDSFHLCRSLVRFAEAICDNYPDQAVRWAEQAHLWEPWNAYTWTILTKAIRQDKNRGLDSALAIAWEAIERFPDNVVVHTGLGEVLKAAGKLLEAEAVYRETIERFPDKFPHNLYARNGLAAVLRLLGKDRLSEALTLVEQTLQQEPTNVEAWTEKARILENLDQIEEADAAFERARMSVSPKVTPPADYGEQLRLLAEYREKPGQHIGHAEAIAISAHARFLRRWARRNEFNGEQPSPSTLRTRAQKMLDELIQAKPYHARARTEKGLLLLESGQYGEAKRFLTESVELFPGEAALRYALARAEREIACRERRRLDPARLDAVTAEWNRLHSLNPAFGPLEDLGKGRAWLVQLDGRIVRQEALNSLNKIRLWMRPHLHLIGNGKGAQTDDAANIRRRYAEKKGFEQWWSREIQAYLFGPIDINVGLNDEHLDLIVQRLEQYNRPIDTLEEDFAIRLSL